MSSREVTVKSVDKIVEAISDIRFKPVLFGNHISQESEYTNSVFFDVILGYITTMSHRHETGITSFGNNDIQATCYQMLHTNGMNYSSRNVNLYS